MKVIAFVVYKKYLPEEFKNHHYKINTNNVNYYIY